MTFTLRTLLALLLTLSCMASAVRGTDSPAPAKALRILPLGDSLTRGSYLRRYPDGEPVGLPNPDGGGYRKPLQDKLRAAGIAFDFVGELSYDAFGRDGRVDPSFDPDHQGMAGFSNEKIIQGGPVPTPHDVLAALGTKQVIAHGVVAVLEKYQPDLILLVSGGNGFDAPARDRLITLIGEHSTARLLVGTITPQKPPRAGYEQVAAYNQSLPGFVAARQQAGQKITLVDLFGAVSADDLLPDGVHPNAAGMQQIADAWFEAIQALPELRSARR